MPEKIRFNNVVFLKSAYQKKDFLLDKPTLTFIGRSNVGKSTLINGLLQRKNFMKTSKTAGATRAVNYCLVDNKFYLADVPGYGFASFERDSFPQLMKDFLEENKALKKVYLLIDSRRLLLPADDEFCDYLEALHMPYAFVFTKIDKLSGAEKADLKLQEEKLAPAQIFEVALKKEELYQKIRKDIVETIKGA